ncbi:unnamed protein product [Dovyalis caffra]|uniref:Protein kinase domain-containing protein n=1 Tax=Dovyalis caffra TaxID=77055 RepID=A0AAV1RFB4_9ROSI|nr:unnamed protein product [Dovyalis caffra]
MELVFAALLLAYLHSFVLSDLQGDALSALKVSMNIPDDQLKDWNPNQVNPCTWTNVICDTNNNVISVTLSGINCSGTLSPKIGALKTLTTLYHYDCYKDEMPNKMIRWIILELLEISGTLSQNNLSGAIPESLAGLQSLINILLDSNNLIGQIPDHLFRIPKYNFTGNHLNCGGQTLHPCESHNSDSGDSHRSKIGLIVGLVGGFTILFLLGGLLFFVCKGRHKGSKREVFVDVAGEVDRRIAFGQLKRFAWRELQLATDNFSEKNILGQGGFGKVYKGVLADNTKVAVKRLTDFESPGGDAAFQREVEMISVAVHRNLLRLIGFCTTTTERLLVYPFMQNLSVAYRLRGVCNTVSVGVNDYVMQRPLSSSSGSIVTEINSEGIELVLVKKLEREKRLDAIVDRNLNKNYNIQEVEMMIQVALLCTQASPEDRPAMSDVVRMLEGEGLAERWEEWQHVEVTRRQEYERLQRRFDWGEDSVYNQDAIELSGGR